MEIFKAYYPEKWPELRLVMVGRFLQLVIHAGLNVDSGRLAKSWHPVPPSGLYFMFCIFPMKSVKQPFSWTNPFLFVVAGAKDCFDMSCVV